MKNILFYFITVTTMMFSHTLYAAWNSCPPASAVENGNYAPFVLCSGKIENAKVLNMVYTNAFKANGSQAWGLCKYRNPNTLAEVYIKIPLNGSNDVTPTADQWLAMSGQYFCGFEQRAFISPDKNPQFNY